MALFVFLILIFNNCITFLLGSENRNGILEIKPTSVTGGQNVGFYKVEDDLNLTCIFRNETFLPNINLDWIFPLRTSKRQNCLLSKVYPNTLTLTIVNLQESDSGDYKCTAVQNGIPYFKVENSIRISVKNKKKECTEAMFQCSAGICIPKRYICDGQNDCHNGEDESLSHCGPGNPCHNKLRCPDNRCIPIKWCCELHRDPNCTAKVKPECCTQVEKLTRNVENDLSYQYDQTKFNDIGFLQTTVYTVIGCAMAFMFIVTIIVIAICRVHVRRTLLSRCPPSNRSLPFNRRNNIQNDHINGLSFYDLDLYFSRSGINGNNLMSVNPLLVTYNINNGVHIVGRPVDPPPYCEIVTSPPKEGPPPPYISHENLAEINCNGNAKPKGFDSEPKDDQSEIEGESTESDALLCATSQNVINKVDCSAIDIDLDEGNMTSIENTEVETDAGKFCGMDLERSAETLIRNDSSHNEAFVLKPGEMPKNSKFTIAEKNPSISKGQEGESSSYALGNDKNIPNEAIKKIVNVNSIEDDSCPIKTNGFSNGQIKKF